MGTQLIFCVECDNTAQTDKIYIKSTIEHFYPGYDQTRQIKLAFVLMNGKGNYAKSSIRKKVDGLRNTYRAFNPDSLSVVIYCFDCDDYASKPEDKAFLQEAEEFCRENRYKYVWFCRDIEEVYLGQRISDNEKRRRANKFAEKKGIKQVDKNRLCVTQYRNKCSNLCAVLEEYIK